MLHTATAPQSGHHSGSSSLSAKYICETLERRLFLTRLAGPALDVDLVAPSSSDFDGDGVSDVMEEQILARFSPILVPNDSEEFIPITVTEFLRRSTVWSDVHGGFVTSPSPGSLDPRAITGHLDMWYRWEPHSPEDRNEARANSRIYGRVTHPSDFPAGLVVAQYYALFMRNAANAPNLCTDRVANRDYGCGDHDGDLLSADFTIDTRQNPPLIVTAIYHNHGRQLYIEPSALTFQGTHPVMFLEKGTNEPWPNRGSVAMEGWPSVGVTTNEVREWLLDEWDPADVFREHWGNDVAIAPPVVNLGEMGPDGRRIDIRSFAPGSEPYLMQQEAKFLMEFRGQWGTTFYGLPFSDAVVDSPKGPYYNSEQKMWGRATPGGLNPLLQYRPATTPRATAGTYDDRVVVTWDVVPFARNYYVHRTGGPGGPQYWAPGFDGSGDRHPEENFLIDTTAVRGIKYTYMVGVEWREGPDGTIRTMNLYGTADGYVDNVKASDGEFNDRVRITFAEVNDSELFNYALVRTRTDGSEHTFFDSPWVRSNGVVQFDDMTARRGIPYRYHAYWYGRNAAGEYNSVVTDHEDTGFVPSTQASDREFVDRVRVTWLPVNDPEFFNYGVHRFRDGTYAGFIDHPAKFQDIHGLIQFDDLNVEAGSTYRYEVSWFGRNAAGEYNNHVPNGYEAWGRVLPFAELDHYGQLTLTGTDLADNFSVHHDGINIRVRFRSAEYVFPVDAVKSLTVRGNAELDEVILTAIDPSLFAIDRFTLSSNVGLDLGTASLVIRDMTLSAVTSLIRSARNTAPTRWTGPGLTSSAAAADPFTTLAVGLLGDDIIVKHTYNGDANLDGKINSDDYFRIDSGFLAQPTTPYFTQGDFNYDGRINSDDYFLIDSAFLGQSASPAASAVSTSSAVALTSLPADTEPQSTTRKRGRPTRPLADLTAAAMPMRRRKA